MARSTSTTCRRRLGRAGRRTSRSSASSTSRSTSTAYTLLNARVGYRFLGEPGRDARRGVQPARRPSTASIRSGSSSGAALHGPSSPTSSEGNTDMRTAPARCSLAPGSRQPPLVRRRRQRPGRPGRRASSPPPESSAARSLYQGPRPCSANGHIVGNAIVLVFDRRNPPPPSGPRRHRRQLRRSSTGDVALRERAAVDGGPEHVLPAEARLHRDDHGAAPRSPSSPLAGGLVRDPGASSTTRATSCRRSSSASCPSRATSAAAPSTRPTRSSRSTPATRTTSRTSCRSTWASRRRATPASPPGSHPGVRHAVVGVRGGRRDGDPGADARR